MRRREAEDFTQGAVFPKLMSFAVPIMLGSLLQMLYNTADLAVAGRYGSGGANSLAAIGATSAIYNMIFNFFSGLSVGSGVIAAHAKGAKDDRQLYETVHTAIPAALICGTVIAVVCAVFIKTVLTWTGTPEKIIDLSVTYLRIVFAAAPASMICNYGASLLRAMGDSKRPLYIFSCSGALNVLLNLFFVVVLKMDVAGVAAATAITTCLSAAAILLLLTQRQDAGRLYLRQMKIYGGTLVKMIKIGLPAAVQSALHSLSNVVIQKNINSFGESAVAGNTAAISFEGIVWCVHNAFTTAGLTFMGQNYGAKKYERFWRIAFAAFSGILITSAVFFIGTNFFGKEILGVFIDRNKSPEALSWGMIRFAAATSLYVFDGIMDVSTGLMRGLGYSTVPMASTVFFICVFRIGWVYTVFAAYPTYRNLMLSLPASWILGSVFGVCAFAVLTHKVKKRILAEKALPTA